MYESCRKRYTTVEKDKKHQAEIESAIDTLLNTLKENPDIWGIRKEVARLLFDNSRYKEAADIVWSAPEIPAVDLEIAFAARVLSRDQPKRAIRLLKHVQEKALNSPAKLLAIANALMHYGMVLQAAKFYGAATARDSELANNADLEFFMLWLDDSQRLWGDWAKDGQKMEDLPWVKRDQGKGGNFEKMMSGLTTPIKVPGLQEATTEHLLNEYYRQVPIKDGEITAPPAVTVPLDQLKPDDVIHDETRGAFLTPPKGEPIVDFKAPQSIAKPDESAVKMTFPTLNVDPEAVAEEAPKVAPEVAEVPKEAADEPKRPKFLF